MKVLPDPNRGLYTLLEPLKVVIEPRPDYFPRLSANPGYKYGFAVPEDFSWDGASIPRVAWSAIGFTPFHPRLMRASCIHDYLYTIKKGSRRDADELFQKILIEDGVMEHAAGTMYRAVRNFGSYIWKDEEDLRREAELLEIQEAKADN